jgi:predicted adenine nucleotide alpha hydrolase (AANH) superfamily ATPase
MKVLLHICCAPCAILPFEQLCGAGHDVLGFWFNPNIHPFVEFRRRLKALKVLQERIPLPVVYDERYGMTEFLRSTDWQASRAARCATCYRLRLRKTAEEAAARGLAAFTTTLLSSTHQDHELIRRTGSECAAAQGVEFLYRDWRPLSEESHERARGLKLYMQSYCGCMFSEWERYRETRIHTYRGSGPLAEGPEWGEGR